MRTDIDCFCNISQKSYKEETEEDTPDYWYQLEYQIYTFEDFFYVINRFSKSKYNLETDINELYNQIKGFI
jgi:hypothetical protein